MFLALFAKCVVMLFNRMRCIFGRGGNPEVRELCAECYILKVVFTTFRICRSGVQKGEQVLRQIWVG